MKVNQCSADCRRPATWAGLCSWHHFQNRQQATAARQQGVDSATLAQLRRRLETLLAAGVPAAQIVLDAGINRQTIQWILSGRAEAGVPPGYRIGWAHAARIRAIPIPAGLHAGAPDYSLVAAVGTVRRLRALVAAGHPVAELAERLGVGQETVAGLLDDRADGVVAALARSVASMFDALQMRPGTSQAAKKFAASRGWLPPLAWDEEALDDPEATAHRGGGKRTGFVELYTEMRMLGFSDQRIAERLGVKPASLLRQIDRYGLTPTDDLVSVVCRAKWEKRRAS
jgi:transcriptional regulator with XRE-family HTH domain